MNTKCPNCGSQDTARCAVAYKAGTKKSFLKGVGMDLSGDIGVFGGTSMSQTLLAASNPPPKPRATNSMGPFFLIVGALALILGIGYYEDSETHEKILPILSMISGPPIAIIGILMIDKDNRNISDAHKSALADWLQQWICMRCEEKFFPEA